MPNKCNHKAFTLVEIILVMALITIVAALTLPFMSSFFALQQLNAITDEVEGNLRRAQNKAIIIQDNTQWGIACQAASGYYTIEKDPNNKDGLYEEYEVYEFPTNISISCNDIVFDKLTGKTVGAIINISNSAIDEEKNINISQQGTIQIQ